MRNPFSIILVLSSPLKCHMEHCFFGQILLICVYIDMACIGPSGYTRTAPSISNRQALQRLPRDSSHIVLRISASKNTMLTSQTCIRNKAFPKDSLCGHAYCCGPQISGPTSEAVWPHAHAHLQLSAGVWPKRLLAKLGNRIKGGAGRLLTIIKNIVVPRSPVHISLSHFAE